jgi:hypothetical protein
MVTKSANKLQRKEKPLGAVRPNAGIAAAYRRKLTAILDAVSADAERQVLRVYRANMPEIALDEEPSPETLTNPEIDRIRTLAEGGDATLPGPQGPNIRLQAKGLIRLVFDADEGTEVWELTAAGEKIARKLMTPATRLTAVMKNLRAKWLSRINDTAPKLAAYFNTAVAKRSKAVLGKVLRDGGFSVKFAMTDNMRTVYDATIAENVGLIKSIPSQYLDEVEGLVMRSVTRGRDLGELTKELRKRYKITERRAALIALDQNNKATSAIVHTRQLDLGIKFGIWRHSHAGKEPRPTHVKMDGKKYQLAKGLYDSDPRVKRDVFPGELIRCRCFWQPVVAGFD